MSSARQYRVGRQFLWVAGGRLLGAVLQAALMVLLIRSVSPAEFGLFSAAYGVVTVAQTGLDFGLPTFALRERAADARNAAVTNALKLNNTLAMLMAAVLGLGLLVLGVTVSQVFLAMIPLAVWAAAERNADAWLGVAFADGDAYLNTVNLLGRRLLNLAVFIPLLYVLGVDGILAFSISSAFAAAAASIFAHRVVSPRLMVPSAITRMALFRASWPYWFNSVSTQLRNLDSTVAAVVTGTVQGGYYAAASRLTGPLRIIPTSLAAALLPAAAKTGRPGVRRLLLLAAGCIAGLTILYAVGVAIVPALVPMLLGDEYSGAILPIQLTLAGLVFAGTASLLGSMLQGYGFKHFVAGAAFATTIVCLLGVAVGGVIYGAAGAAGGLAVSFVVQSALLGGCLWKFVRSGRNYGG